MEKLKNPELNRIDIQTFKKSKKTPIIIVLDNIRSLHNIGSVFRTCDAFLIEKIYLCGITATPPHKEIHKTALGATDSVEWVHINETIEAINLLKKNNVKVLAIEQAKGSTMLQEFNLLTHTTYALVLGNEVKGVQQEVVNACDGCIEIPQFGTKHSLNIAVSASIVIWEVFRKMMDKK